MMPTMPLFVVSAAGLTAGSIPMLGSVGNASRRCLSAAADAVLEATTTALQPRAIRNRVIASQKCRICSCGR